MALVKSDLTLTGANRTLEAKMPLRHYPLLADLDLETRAMLSQVYLEACRDLEKPSLNLVTLDNIRAKLGDIIIRLALSGERNPTVIKAKALEALERAQIAS